ncbi:unnamed protein product [Orchesella dallaii]|uniref:Uncharacterized protein n=1 Tax=Orchesella dallaii TaxID=48710 RepID=A0ABP1QRX3_9HEXA
MASTSTIASTEGNWICVSKALDFALSLNPDVQTANLSVAGSRGGEGDKVGFGGGKANPSPFTTGRDGSRLEQVDYSNPKRLPKSNSLPNKSLLSNTKSDGSGGGGRNTPTTLNFSDKIVEQRRNSGSGSGFHGSPTLFLDHQQRNSGDRIFAISSQASNGMQQVGNARSGSALNGTSRVCSPSLTLDSGRGSSSAPSSPAKEMSPVQMSGGTALGVGGSVGASSATSSSSQNASPVFARKLSRPMEYLLGQQSESSPAGFVGESSSSGNYGTCCSSASVSGGSSEPPSFHSASALNYNQNIVNNNNNENANGNHNPCFSSGGDSNQCEILQITEDYEVNVGGLVGRKDSLGEEVEAVMMISSGGGGGDTSCRVDNHEDVISASSGGGYMQPQFLVGGDIMQPDLDVPNEVFGPVSHAEILNKNLSANINLNSVTGKQGSKIDTPTNSSIRTRARSSSGDGSNRSTPLSALYGTPHWWPESPPPEEHNFCPPAPPSSCNVTPFKKPYLLNNLTNYVGSTRLKGNSCTSSLTDHGKDLTSLESTHSQKSTHTASSSSSVPGIPTSLASTTGDNGMEVKKFTPMAFTIDFGESEGSAGPQAQAAEAKKAAIAERLSKFAPRHRRNQSLTKGEDLPEDSSSSKQGKSGTNSLGRSSHHQKHSSVGNESCTSTAPKTGSLPKKLSGAKHPSGGSTSNNDSGLRSLSPETISSTTSSSSRSRPLASTELNKSNSVTTPTPKSRDNNNTISSAPAAAMANKSRIQQGRNNTPNNNSSAAQKRVGKSEKKVAPLNDLSKESSVVVNKAAVAPAPVPVADKEDTVSEAGTYTVEKEVPEVINARENIEEIFGLTAVPGDGDGLPEKESNLSVNDKTFGAEPGTRDWVREWAELAAQQHQQKQRPELPETQYFLRETETLVTAIQERVSKHMKSGGGSGGGGSLPHDNGGGSDSEDEPTLMSPSHHLSSQSPTKSLSQHSTPTNTNKKRPPSRSSPFHREASVLSDSGYAIGYQSDSSNDEGSRSHGIPPIKLNMNRAFNIRRGRVVGYDSDGYASEQLHLMMNQQQSMTLALNQNARGISPKAQTGNNNSKYNNVGRCAPTAGATASVNTNSSSPLFGRNDGGRFSLRMPKSRTPPAQMPPPAPRHPQNSYGGPSGETHGRSMMNGNKSDSNSHSSTGPIGNKSSKLTPKGVNGPNGGKKPGNRSNSTLTAKEVEMANWKRRKNYDPMKAAAEGKKGPKKGTNSGGESGVEEEVRGVALPLPPIPSPKVHRREAMMTKSLSFHQESFSPKCVSEDEDMIYIVDEMDSSHSNSPNHLGGMTRSYHEDVMYYGMPHSNPIRPKNKLEALDNLVIATIHSLSNKVRTSSRHLLEKLQVQHANDENGALIEEMVSQLKELEGPTNNTSPNKSPSRELSGTLKNLKKLEQVILVLDKVLCDDFESDAHA